eukprot:6459162-Amphidinium_carterae.1
MAGNLACHCESALLRHSGVGLPKVWLCWRWGLSSARCEVQAVALRGLNGELWSRTGLKFKLLKRME